MFGCPSMLDRRGGSAYYLPMKKHTTMDLDMDLVDEASVALGTRRISETVHAALAETVALRRRLRLLELDPDLTLERLESERRDRHPAAR